MSACVGGRRVTSMEELCEVGHQHGTLLSCYLLRLASSRPLLPGHLQQALLHLRRKVPILRLCYEERGGTTWLKETTNEEIDFEVEEGDVENVMTALKTYRYNSEEGPLWCVRFMPGHSYPPAYVVATADSPFRPDTGIELLSQDTSMALTPLPDTPRPDTSTESSTRPDTGLGLTIDPNTGCVSLQPGEVIIVRTPNTAAYPEDIPLLIAADEIPAILTNGGMPPSPEPLDSFGPRIVRLRTPTPRNSLPNGTLERPYMVEPPTPEPDDPAAARPDPASAPSSPPSLRRTRRYAGSHQGVENTHGSVPARLDHIITSLGQASSTQSSLTDTTSSMSAFVETSSSYSGPPSPRQAGAVASAGASRNSNFPSLVLLGFHSGVADGITALKICGLLVHILDDVITETHIDDCEQLGDFLMEGEVLDLVAERRVALETDPVQKEQLLADMEERKLRVSSLDAVFRTEDTGNEEPHHETQHLDTFTTTQFLEKCRAEGVKFHSAFCALANISLMELAAAKEGRQDSYTIYSSHATDLRRYWRGNSSRALGCLVAPTHLSTVTSRYSWLHFWDYVRDFQQDLKNSLNNCAVLQDAAVQQLPPLAPVDYQQLFSFTNQRLTDYLTSNLGDVTPLLAGGGAHVRPEYLEISTSLHKTNYSCSHMLHTFQGRLTFTLDYNGRYLTEEMAREYIALIFQKLKEVV